MQRDTRITEIGLSNRIANALEMAGIDTAEKFISAKSMELIRGIGKKGMEEITPMVEKVSRWECFRREPTTEEIERFVDLWCHGFSYDQARVMDDLLFKQGKEGIRSGLEKVLSGFRFDNGESVIINDKLVNRMFRKTLIRVATGLLEFCIDDLTPDDISRSIMGNILVNKINRFLPEPQRKI